MSLVSIALLVWIIIQSSDQACEDGDIRLSGGRHYREGRVEVCRNQQWGRVCDDAWDKNDSTVVCRQLGLSEEDAQPVIDSRLSAPEWYGPSTLSFFALDDVGCNGSESNLLDCLPQHNCGIHLYEGEENAGVQCLCKGVKLEYGPNQESNNTLITVNGIQENNAALFCSTDRENCCIDEFNIPGSWFLPNESKISTTNTQSLGNQTVGLNLSKNAELPSGIYHCEMMDRENITHHLYAGIYPEDGGNISNTLIKYDRVYQTIICTSIGGPATDVTWYKDNAQIIISNEGGTYNYSQIIINTMSATYENRLRIEDKSSEAAGNYTCEVKNSRGSINESLYIQVCRDLEFRVNNKTINGHRGLVEVCIDDQWHGATRSAQLQEGNNFQLPQGVSVMIAESTSTSVMIQWSGQQSSPNSSNKNISGYDLSCTTASLSDHGQIHEVRVPNISTSTTRVQVSGLLLGMAYQCCVNAHIQTNTPLDLISSNCVTTSTSYEKPVTIIIKSVQDLNSLIIGLGVGLGVCSLLLLVSILVGLNVSKTMSCTSCLKRDSTTQGNIKRVTEEYDLVANPIYNISMQRTPQRRMITASTTVATTTRSRGDAAAI